MFRMNGMSRAHGCAGVTMFRMNGAFIAPAKTTLPPSMAVVCDCAKVTMFRMNGAFIAPAETTLPPSMGVVCDGPIDALM